LLLACCAVKPPPKASIVVTTPQVAAAKQPSAAPNFAAIRDKSREADDANARTAERIKQAKVNLNDTHFELQAILLEVDLMVKKTFATENDLIKHWNRLVEHEKRYSILKDDMEKATESLEQERILRAEVNSRLSETEAQIRAKDAEADQLRGQLSNEQRATQAAAEQAAAYRDQVDHKTELLAGAYRDTAKEKGANELKTKIMIGLGIALLLSVALNVLQLRDGIL
jgi:chromosome condensin MukBEF ATPase and DNA-binding subunit MukB